MRVSFHQLALSYIQDETASTATEYAIVASLISIIIITVVGGIGSSLNNLYYDQVQNGLATR